MENKGHSVSVSLIAELVLPRGVFSWKEVPQDCISPFHTLMSQHVFLALQKLAVGWERFTYSEALHNLNSPLGFRNCFFSFHQSPKNPVLQFAPQFGVPKVICPEEGASGVWVWVEIVPGDCLLRQAWSHTCRSMVCILYHSF